MADDKKQPEFDHQTHIIAEWAPEINKVIRRLKIKGEIPSHIEDEELHAHGIHGLMDAFANYKKERGPFTGYAKHRIRGIILDHVHSSGGRNAVPQLIRQQAKQFEANKAAQAKASESTPQVTPESTSQITPETPEESE